ncbi:hypothetical protein LTR27_000575 [Elasticomyces elasticus]|nr:hypothetical protein LTR27_000575 [Elasticomyces elasticus]
MTSLSTTQYTPLEQLLLFQALRHEGVNNGDTINLSFNRISEQLKAIPTVRNDAAYDADRLSPDALRELYLWLLKEEIKHDLQREVEGEDDHATTNGDTRKRKAPSPPLPTVEDAVKHAYLIPQLVTRLYATYRERAVSEIRKHEQQYDTLSREVQENISGKQDVGSQEPGKATPQSPKPSSIAHTQPASQRPEFVQPVKSRHATPAAPAEAPPKKYSLDAVMNHGPEPQNGFSGHRRTSSNTTLPPLSEMAPQSPHFGIPPKMPMASNMQPYPQQQYAQAPSNMHPPSYGPPHGHPMPGVQLQNAMARPSSSPRPTLPLPPGMKLPHPSPVQHSPSPNMRAPNLPQQHYQPQHRTSMGPAGVGDRPSHPYSPQLPPPGGYYQPQPYPDRRTSYPEQQHAAQQRYPVQAPHQGGYQMQPWPMDGSQPSRPPPQKQNPLPQPQSMRPQFQPPTPIQRAPSYPPHPNAPLTAPRPSGRPNLLSSIVTALGTPSRAERRPIWKSERRPPPLMMPSRPSTPPAEPLSPVLTRAKSPARAQKSAAKRSSAATADELAPAAPSASKTRSRKVRDRSPHSGMSSAGGETMRTRTRSQSVSTSVGGIPGDGRPGSRDSVKPEPSTPAETLEAPEHVPEPSATPASGPMTRKRRGTMQSQPQPSSKRQRQQSPVRPDEIAEAGSPPPRPTTVLATRNFNKLASTIMNDITSHKHASYFAGPVRDKDASGYSGIIKQPQHLKSIRAAITAGTRAIAAATSSLESPAVAPTAASAKAAEGSTIELDRNDDLIPPKAIVNGVQLEKEVYRMFANAVMFNPGEDGLVADTRAMFEDVEAQIREWRGAEAVAPEEEVVEESKGKRRKL